MKHNYNTTHIVSIKKETEKVKTFVLNKSITAKPGQYVMVWIPRLNEKPFGVVASSPLTISIAKVGPFTQAIHSLRVGDPITYRGPYGSSFTAKSGNILLVGGGYGVVPLYYFASELVRRKKTTVTVVIGARTKNDIVFAGRFRKLGCMVKIATDDGSLGFAGYSPDLAAKLVTKEQFSGIYACGPEIMMKKVAKLAADHNIFCQVSVERFFKCGGIGICGECSFHGHLVCKDGPVFAGALVLKNES